MVGWLGAEAAPYFGDFQRGNVSFDTKEKMIEALKGVNRQDIIALYRSLILNENSMRLVVQLRGEKFKDSEFATIKTLKTAKMQDGVE